MKKIKQILAIILCVMLLGGILPSNQTGWLKLPDFSIKSDAAATTYTDGYYTYSVLYGEATIVRVSYNNMRGDITIPATLGGYPVTAIMGSTTGGPFTNCDMLTSITIPNTVTTIGMKAFYNCTSLATIIIPDSVTTIEASAFEKTAYYNNPTNWPQGVLYIGNHLIEAKTTITGVLDILNGTRVIAQGAFAGCNLLESVSIPNGVVSICDEAFSRCVLLKSITIPSSVGYIGEMAFRKCGLLEEIYLPNNGILISNDAFYGTKYYDDELNWENDVLYIGKHLIKAKGIITGSYKIKEGTLTIAEYAFSNQSSLASIDIPNSLISINSFAFSSCTGLETIVVPNSVTKLCSGVFSGCSSLKSISISSGINEICNGVFSGCSSLKTITIPDGVTKIGDSAFSSCPITSITIPNSVTELVEFAFYRCTSLETIVIPSSVTKLEKGTFYECVSLKSITIPESVTSIGLRAFGLCSNLSDVYYTGTNLQRDEIFIDEENEYLIDATWHYNFITPLISVEVFEGILKGSDVESVTIEPISIYENTFGEAMNYSSTEKYYCYCNWTSFLSYTIELKNGDTVEAPNGYFEYDGELYELFSAHSHKEYEERYEVGETYTEWVRILGEEYAVNITIAPSPVVDIEIEPVTILEGTKCDTFDDYCVYRWYEEMPWKIKLNNGKTLNSNTQVVIIDGKNYSFEYSDNQSDDNHWKVGETYICHATFLGVTVDIPVTITDTPIKNVQFEDIIVYENVDGMLAKQYNPETGREEEYFKYNWSQYIPYTVTFIDGEEISGVGSGFGYGDEYYYLEWNDTQNLQNKWTVGNSYGQQVSVGGKNYTVCIRVEENPVKSVSIANITVPQGMNASFSLEYDAEVNEHFEYLRYDLVPFLDYTVTFKDDSFVEATRYGFNYKGRHYGATVQSIQNHKNEWQPDNVYYANVQVMGNENIVPVYIEPIPEAEGFTYVVNNREITIMECFKDGEDLIIPEMIGEYPVTTIQNLSRAKNFTKLYLPSSIESLSWIDFTQFENLSTIYYSGDEYDWRYISKHYNGFGDIEIIYNYSSKQGKAEPPSVLNVIGKTVTLTAVSGCEYSIDGITWQSSNVFADLKCGEQYTFYQRFAKTDTTDAGEISEGFRITMPEHTYTNACDNSCNLCGTTRTTSHRYNAGVVTKAATCKQTGVRTFTCTICKATKTQTIAKTTTHSYKTTTTKATTSKNGKIVKKCSVCGVTASTTTVYYAKTIKLSATSYTYNGKAKTPTVTVKDSKGKTISKSYYTVKYASGRKNVGKYKVTITFKGNYSGTKTLYFTINPVKTSVSKITAAKKALTVTISKKSTQVTGYEIQYSTSKKFTKSTTKTKTVKSYKTTKYSIKSLKAKKTYYVRVRTYKTVSGKKYYSGWSTVKSKKTK